MTNQKKHSFFLYVAALITIISLFAILTFETLHTGHELNCHEEDCPVCLVLQILHNTKNNYDDTPFAWREFVYFYYINILIFSALLLVPATLVRQKIKLVI